MEKIIRDIIDKKESKEEKIKELEELLDDIEIAKGILNGEFNYCPKCNDYYLSESFGNKKETKPTKICIWNDPINSGGNEYEDGYVDIEYAICPKGHKIEISRKEKME